MRRLPLAALLAAGVAAAAPPPPAPLNAEALAARAEALVKLAADLNASDVRLRTDAASLFESMTVGAHVQPPTARRPEIEPVTGETGTVPGLLAEAERRAWRREPPPPGIRSALETARDMRRAGRLDFADGLAEEQMGTFEYQRGSADPGWIKFNLQLPDIARYVGFAFAYAPFVHEAAHAEDKANGLLSPEDEIAGEVRAFQRQYQWLLVIDPSGRRLGWLCALLGHQLDLEPTPSRELLRAVDFVNHLVLLRRTGGDARALEDFVRSLGYGRGHQHGPTPMRA